MQPVETKESIFKRFNYSSWNDISVNDVPALLNLLPQMPPDVQNKVLGVIRSIPELATELNRCYTEIVDHGFSSNDSTVKEVNEADRAIIDTIRKLLDRSNLSDTQEERYFAELRYYSGAMHETAEKNRSFIARAWDSIKTHQNELFAGSGLILGALFGYFVGKHHKGD